MAYNELYHHGVKGMKWGVRRYQYADGSLTPLGQRRRNVQNETGIKRKIGETKLKVDEKINQTRYKLTGQQHVNDRFNRGTTFARVQTSKDFEGYAFYATYKKADKDKYLGLFGKNLTGRAAVEAKKAEELAEKSGSKEDKDNAKALRERADNMKVYQVRLETTKRLSVPSTENAADITSKLIKDKEFKDDLVGSIADVKTKMKRPAQQLLFNQAQKALEKEPERMTSNERVAVYKALNLSLTYHNEQQQRCQNRFYGELKKKGYDAILDVNDREYSSYHAKRPMIVFNTDSIRLKAVTETDPKVVDVLYKKYNRERVSKEAVANTLGLLGRIGHYGVSEAESYVKSKQDDYLR